MVSPQKGTEGYGSEFWERLSAVIGMEKPFAWASKVGIPKSTFSHCMSGRCILPLKHLMKVSDATGLSLNWLITGVDGDEERHTCLIAGEEVLNELIDFARTLPAGKQEMVRDIVKRIAEEESGTAKGRRRGGN